MTCLQMTLPLPGNAPAVLVLPQPLPPQALLDLGQALAGTLELLRRDAAEVEYASWMSDPGDIEVASWTAAPRAGLR